MIVPLLLLWSLCAIYITHFLRERKMKVAAISYTVLYCYLIAWTYLVFVIDIVNYGFEQTRAGLLFGSNIYHAFLGVSEAMDKLTGGTLVAVIIVCFTILGAVIIVLALSGISFYLILRKRNNYKSFSAKKLVCLRKKYEQLGFDCIYIKNCRLNC